MRRTSLLLAAAVTVTLALAACSSRNAVGPQAAAPNPMDTGWPTYGGDPGGTRYSP